MTYVEYRHGALTVIQQAHDRDEIQRLIKEIDPRLFIERQLGFDEQPVWCVVCDIGGDYPPVTLIEWRDQETNQPINELSSGLVERVARMERDGAKLADKVIRHNMQLSEARRKQSVDNYVEMAKEFESNKGKITALPRGQSLRMARDKQRGRGEKV